MLRCRRTPSHTTRTPSRAAARPRVHTVSYPEQSSPRLLRAQNEPKRSRRCDVRRYGTESANGHMSKKLPPPRYSGFRPRDTPSTAGPDPEHVEKNLAEWLMTLVLVAGLGGALVADSDEREPSSVITSQNLGVFMLVGASAFALWAGLDYFQAASALADHIPVRGRTLRILAFSLFLSGAFAGASVLPPRSSSRILK